ncbi:EAL domain-containing protein [Neptuniibacter sp.]|uniref:bifunctional diguanylate cyclase/phosphodiesterase n=1 Tax=Neptuniibacter sp. TaxID=1962643 RepID=UPI002612DDF8|nr:EAL domain-containing protein [Neptuniibacter sp.]MCP4597618.1 EAL domain-containing protein [Neptuniibacter sp.]
MPIRTILLTLTLFCCVVAGISVALYYRQTHITALEREESSINTAANLLSVELETTLKSYKQITATMAAMPPVREVLAIENRQDRKSYIQAKALLNDFCINNLASICYLLSPQGDVVIENRRDIQGNLEGNNYAFRPYFKKSMLLGDTVYAAYGITTHKRGIYFGHKVVDQNNEVLGVAVVKVPVEKFEQSLKELSGISLLLDPDGVVFASKRESWVLKSLWGLSESVQTDIQANRQYAGKHIENLGFTKSGKDNRLIQEADSKAYFVGEADLLSLPGWRILHLEDVDPVSPFSSSIVSIVSWMFLVASFTSLLLFRMGMRDLRRRLSAEDELKNSEIRLRQLTELTSEGILIHQQGTIIDSNHAAEEIFGYRREELITADIWQLMAPECVSTAVHHMLSGYERPYDIEGQRKGGEIFPMEICARDSLLRGEGIRVCCIRDLTQSQKQVTDRLSKAIEAADREGKKLTVLYIDLDNFKRFNDSWGHDFGDRLLTATTQRFRTALSKHDSLIRYSGDEFIVLLNDLVDENKISRRINRLIRILKEEYMIEGRNISLSATFGIASYPEHGVTSKELLQNAELAMYRCREMGGQGYFAFYSNEMSDEAQQRLTLEQHLRHVIENDELSLHYQPVYYHDDGNEKLCSAEVLVRWNSAELGFVGPDKFIPIAENTGLIVEIGRWILHSACVQGMIWSQAKLPEFRMAVNVSPRQLQQQNFIEDLKLILSETGFPAERLCLEITEGILLEDDQFASHILQQIKALGVQLAIDDFGTGYSSLSYLKRYPFDYLKIDRSFVMDMERDESHQQLVKASILMAHGMSLKVIAEGVENKDQLNYLKQQSCDYFQGYLLSKPIPADSFRRVLEKSTRRCSLNHPR